MSDTAYLITLHPKTTQRTFGVGICDLEGVLWQFWGSPSFGTITVFPGESENIDFRPAVQGRLPFDAINLKAHEIDPQFLTPGMVSHLASHWIYARNRNINTTRKAAAAGQDPARTA
jgi:hypothetical protein